MSTRRKLAAVLFADIAGFTQQVSADEVKGLERRRRMEELVKSSAASHSGRVVKTIGDAVMLEFASAVEAVGCALDVQREMEWLNRELGSEEPVHLRVGIHVGDVVEEDNDLYGNAVNIAQRVQDMAPPGGICITREVFVQVRPTLKLHYELVTTPPPKPLPEPVEVFRVTSQTTPKAQREPRRPPLFKPRHAAVAAIALVALAAFAVVVFVAMPRWWRAPVELLVKDVHVYRLAQDAYSSDASNIVLTVRIRVTNQTAQSFSLRPDDFALQVGAVTLRPTVATPQTNYPLYPPYYMLPYRRNEILELNKTNLLQPTQIVPGGSVSSWLRFDNVDEAPNQSSLASLAQQLYKEPMRLRLRAAEGEVEVELLEAQRKELVFKERPAKLTARVAVVEVTGRLNGVNVEVLEQHLAQLAGEGKKKAILLISVAADSLDGVARDWLSSQTYRREEPHIAVAGSGVGFSSEDEAVAHVLATTPDGKAELLALLHRPDAVVRAAVAQALGSLLDADTVARLIERLQKDDQPPVRVAAAKALANLQKTHVRPSVVEALVQAGSDADAGVRDAALETLEKIGAAKAAQDIALRSLQAAPPNLAAVRMVGKNKDKRAVPRLLPLLTDEKYKRAAVQALGDIGDRRALPALLQALKTERETDEEVPRALGKLGDPRIVPALVEAYQRTGWISRHRAILEALGRLGGETALQQCVKAIKYDSWTVKGAAARALGQMKDPRAIPALEQAMRDHAVQDEAINALASIGGPKARSALERAAQSDNTFTRRRAQEALDKMK